MERRRCGDTDLELSALGLGCWKFGGGEYWGEQSQKEVDRVVHRAIDLGINYFDSAEVYNDGRSEQALGKALEDIPRDRVVIGTKVAPSNVAPKMLVAHCEASLQRLSTDYVDLYMLHWPINRVAIQHFTDGKTPVEELPELEEVLFTLDRLRREGKIRYIGVSNFGPSQLRRARTYLPEIVANQLPYNLLSRAIEMEVLPLCRKAGVGVIGYMTVMQGLLTGTYDTLDDVPTNQARTRHFNRERSASIRHGESGAEAEVREALKTLRQVAREGGYILSELAVKWVLAKEGITCALVGTTNLHHLKDNVRAAKKPLPSDIVDRLDETTRPVKRKLGKSIDLFENPENSRIR